VNVGVLVENCSCNSSTAAVAAEFAEVDPLPGAELKPVVGYGNVDGYPKRGGFYVGRHVVGAFVGVGVAGVVFGDPAADEGFEVGTDGWVGVLVNGEGGRRVVDEQVEHAALGEQRGYLFLYGFGDEVKAFGVGRKRDLDLGNHTSRACGCTGGQSRSSSFRFHPLPVRSWRRFPWCWRLAAAFRRG
jgi:hypothetical protein